MRTQCVNSLGFLQLVALHFEIEGTLILTVFFIIVVPSMCSIKNITLILGVHDK